MRLSSAQIAIVEQQSGFQPVSDDHPVLDELKGTFGDHTFFLDREGLNIVEIDEASGADSCNVIKLASWANENRSELLPHEPQMRTFSVDLAAGGPDSAA